MTRRSSIRIILCALASAILPSPSAFAAEACFDHVEIVQVGADSSGTLSLYVFAREIFALAGNGSTYLFYSGSNEVVKAFQAQFLTAKAGGHSVCVVYAPGTPTYRWVLSSVSLADADHWLFE